MDKDYYCNTLVMKHHLNTSTYQKVDSNSNKQVFNNLKFLTKKQESCLTRHVPVFPSYRNLSTDFLCKSID